MFLSRQSVCVCVSPGPWGLSCVFMFMNKIIKLIQMVSFGPVCVDKPVSTYSVCDWVIMGVCVFRKRCVYGSFKKYYHIFVHGHDFFLYYCLNTMVNMVISQ